MIKIQCPRRIPAITSTPHTLSMNIPGIASHSQSNLHNANLLFSSQHLTHTSACPCPCVDVFPLATLPSAPYPRSSLSSPSPNPEPELAPVERNCDRGNVASLCSSLANHVPQARRPWATSRVRHSVSRVDRHEEVLEGQKVKIGLLVECADSKSHLGDCEKEANGGLPVESTLDPELDSEKPKDDDDEGKVPKLVFEESKEENDENECSGTG